LYKHALGGFTGKAGMMPAKGGNAGAADADVKAAVDYMVGLAK
jgi:cytochrome c5